LNFRTFISKDEIQELDMIRFNGEIKVIDTKEELSEVLHELDKHEFLGFDTETKPSFKKGEYHAPAIIQISTLETAYLIRIQKTGFTNELKRFLENASTKKIGISIRDDLKDLQKVRDFTPGGFLDLNNVAQRYHISQIGVRSLTAIFLNKRVSKGQQTSNWENEILTEAQQGYAATDAWICAKMYNSLQKRGFL
jgi:ribonuclease D